MPAIVVNVAVIFENKILLTRREDFEVWCLPSGGVEEGESIAQAARRETLEETGIEVELTRLVGVYSRIGFTSNLHAVLFAARPVGGAIRLQPGETIEVAYFPFEEIPMELSIGHKRRIEDAVHGVTGAAVCQEVSLPAYPKLTHKELLELRDQSGLPKQEFYMQLIRLATIREFRESFV